MRLESVYILFKGEIKNIGFLIGIFASQWKVHEQANVLIDEG